MNGGGGFEQSSMLSQCINGRGQRITLLTAFALGDAAAIALIVPPATSPWVCIKEPHERDQFRRWRCSARMPESPAAPPRRASRKAAATAVGPSWTCRADRCSSTTRGMGVRVTGGRRAGSVNARHVFLVAGRELCRGEELAGSGKLARPDLRAGLFPLAVCESLRIQALRTRFAATGTGSARSIQQQRPVTPLERYCARQQLLTALAPLR